MRKDPEQPESRFGRPSPGGWTWMPKRRRSTSRSRQAFSRIWRSGSSPAGPPYYAGRYAAQLFEDLAGVRARQIRAASGGTSSAQGGADADRTLVVAVTQAEDSRHARGSASRERCGALDVRRDEHLGGTVAGSRRTRPGGSAWRRREAFASQVATLAILAVAVGA